MHLTLALRNGMGLVAALVATTAPAMPHIAQDPTRVKVVAHEYAFESPDSARAGLAAFEFENKGAKDHEMIVGLLRRDVSAADIVAAHQKGINLRQLHTAYLEGPITGLLYALPGGRSPATLIVPLAAGRDYLLLCQFRDSIGAQPHVLFGMFRILHVR
ncbi:MAG: hypothetical protein ABJE10_20390 [bacterium]